MRGTDFWYLAKDERTSFCERMSDALPTDIVISADYTTVNYVLRGRSHVYMLENPLEFRYFGIYGLCDSTQSPLRAVPKPDLVIIRQDYRTSPTVADLLRSSYDHWQVFLMDKAYAMNLFVNPRSERRGDIEAALRTLGATPAPPPALAPTAPPPGSP
jgi:hypothetical protein